MAISVEDGRRWIAGGQVLGFILSGRVVFGATIGDEVGRLVDKCSGLGIGTGVGGAPEHTAEVDNSEFVWNLLRVFNFCDRITIPRLKNIRTNVGENGNVRAGAGVSEARELVVPDLPEVVLNDVLAVRGVGTEPRGVSGGAARDTLNVTEGVDGGCLGVSSGGVELRLAGRRAADERSPFVVDVGDIKITRELDRSNILNCGIKVLGGTVNIEVGEQIRWLNGIVSSTRPG